MRDPTNDRTLRAQLNRRARGFDFPGDRPLPAFVFEKLGPLGPTAGFYWLVGQSTRRSTLRRFIRSRACTTSFLSSTASSRSTVRVASRCPGSMYSPRMRLASSMARRSVSRSADQWPMSGLGSTASL